MKIPLISESAVQVGFDSRVLHPPLNHEFALGQRLLVVGPNGAGKTTYLKSFLDTKLIQSGQRLVHCRSCEIAYVPQSPQWASQVPSTVATFLYASHGAHSCDQRPWSDEEFERQDIFLKRMGFSFDEKEWVQHFSGGRLQKLWLARALMQKAKLILLDEPFSALDAVSRETVVTMLDELRPQTLQIIVLHDPTLIQRLQGQILNFSALEYEA